MMINKILPVFVIFCIVGLITGCGKNPPEEFSSSGRLPSIWPDYTEGVLPPNIAPVNFQIQEEGDSFYTVIEGKNQQITAWGKTVQMPESEWKTLLEENTGETLTFTVFARQEGNWTQFTPFHCTVSTDKIDPYIAYRLIEPGYIKYSRITLNYRSCETFEEEAFVDNNTTSQKSCVNCHSFQNRETKNFLFHVRADHGGTMLIRDGKIVKHDTQSPVTHLAAVYPAWHPTLPLVAFSSNLTRQNFHSFDPNRVEVFDVYSDLVLYDAEADQFTPLPETRTVHETFPSWSFDGKTLFYCAAELDFGNGYSTCSFDGVANLANNFPIHLFFDKYHYNIMKRSFNPDDRTFGPVETVVDTASKQKTALHPRLSKDGRYLVYTRADFGTFPIWHKESDLWLLDTQTGEERAIDEINSPDVESWHTWDSSGKWMVFSSRREDGSYTRLYFTHFDGNGHFTKPFLLPQKDPRQNVTLMKSYNVPEFITEKIPVSAAQLGKAIRTQKALPSPYKGTDK